jgi:curved DNA-binding protein
MKYKDYYQTLGIERSATLDEIKKAYRKLAHKFHPDVSKDPEGEEKFKEIAEAYATLKNPEKRQEYDDLGKRPAGENFAPPPEWQQEYGAGGANFDDVDLADLLNAFRSGGHTRSRSETRRPVPGDDYSVSVTVTLEQVSRGGETDVAVELPEYDSNGLAHRVARTFRVTIPKGAGEGQRLRLGGKGGPGHNGGPPGDLYVILNLASHPLFRVSGRDLLFDLRLSPWEAVLGTTVEIPTLGSKLELKVKPGTSSGQRLRLAKRRLPAQQGEAGNLYAIVHIVVPKTITEKERELLEQLAKVSEFKAREPNKEPA